MRIYSFFHPIACLYKDHYRSWFMQKHSNSGWFSLQSYKGAYFPHHPITPMNPAAPTVSLPFRTSISLGGRTPMNCLHTLIQPRMETSLQVYQCGGLYLGSWIKPP